MPRKKRPWFDGAWLDVCHINKAASSHILHQQHTKVRVSFILITNIFIGLFITMNTRYTPRQGGEEMAKRWAQTMWYIVWALVCFIFILFVLFTNLCLYYRFIFVIYDATQQRSPPRYKRESWGRFLLHLNSRTPQQRTPPRYKRESWGHFLYITTAGHSSGPHPHYKCESVGLTHSTHDTSHRPHPRYKHESVGRFLYYILIKLCIYIV